MAAPVGDAEHKTGKASRSQEGDIASDALQKQGSKTSFQIPSGSRPRQGCESPCAQAIYATTYVPSKHGGVPHSAKGLSETPAGKTDRLNESGKRVPEGMNGGFELRCCYSTGVPYLKQGLS